MEKKPLSKGLGTNQADRLRSQREIDLLIESLSDQRAGMSNMMDFIHELRLDLGAVLQAFKKHETTMQSMQREMLKESKASMKSETDSLEKLRKEIGRGWGGIQSAIRMWAQWKKGTLIIGFILSLIGVWIIQDWRHQRWPTREHVWFQEMWDAEEEAVRSWFTLRREGKDVGLIVKEKEKK